MLRIQASLNSNQEPNTEHGQESKTTLSNMSKYLFIIPSREALQLFLGWDGATDQKQEGEGGEELLFLTLDSQKSQTPALLALRQGVFGNI